MTANSRICVTFPGGNDGERKGVEHCGIGGAVTGRRNGIGRSAGESFVEMQLDIPMAGSGKQGVDQTILGIVLKQGRGQPERLKAVKKLPNLAGVTRPPHVTRARSRTGVGNENRVVMLVSPLGIPPASRQHAPDNWRSFQRIDARRYRHPIEERLPDLFCLRRLQPVRDHCDRKGVVRVYVSLFAPMIIEQTGAIQGEELVEQAAKGIVGGRLDGELGAA